MNTSAANTSTGVGRQLTADTITDEQIRELIEDAEESTLAGYAALGRIDRVVEPTGFADGINEPFCACGRRWSQCDRSRTGCNKYRARARCAEILNARAKEAARV